MVDADETAARERWLTEVSRDGLALGSSPLLLRNDRQVVMAAVSDNGRACEHASEVLRGDKEIVMTAMRNPKDLFWDGTPLEFASEALRADREVVIEAVKWAGPVALRYASASFMTDKDFALAVLPQHPLVFNCISEALCCDPDVLAGVLREGLLVLHVTMISGKACSLALRRSLAPKQEVLHRAARRLSLDPQAVSAQGELFYPQPAAAPLPADDALLNGLASGKVHELQLVVSFA